MIEIAELVKAFAVVAPPILLAMMFVGSMLLVADRFKF